MAFGITPTIALHVSPPLLHCPFHCVRVRVRECVSEGKLIAHFSLLSRSSKYEMLVVLPTLK
eukprot:m.52644 g.52644  ORF g.52644 m.52644 type:complete len:62 (+) comp11786_c1_seq3:425-610(+)